MRGKLLSRVLNAMAEGAWALGHACNAATNFCYRMAGRLYGWSYEAGKH